VEVFESERELHALAAPRNLISCCGVQHVSAFVPAADGFIADLNSHWM
jgi:hypothetical protein